MASTMTRAVSPTDNGMYWAAAHRGERGQRAGVREEMRERRRTEEGGKEEMRETGGGS